MGAALDVVQAHILGAEHLRARHVGPDKFPTTPIRHAFVKRRADAALAHRAVSMAHARRSWTGATSVAASRDGAATKIVPTRRAATTTRAASTARHARQMVAVTLVRAKVSGLATKTAQPIRARLNLGCAAITGTARYPKTAKHTFAYAMASGLAQHAPSLLAKTTMIAEHMEHV